jgi:NarL family two-component system response regulator LiaR
MRAIRQVYRGEPSLHPPISHRLLQAVRRPAAPRPPRFEPLTAREREVLILIAHGLSNQAIASRLVIAETTVRTHVRSILRKLQLASRTQAALYALREGYASLETTPQTGVNHE